MADAPYMPLWVSDFLGSGACSEMTGDQQAFYLLMLVHSWNMKERGLPTDETELRRLLRCSLRLFRSSFTNVSHHFYVQNARFFHQRVDEELSKVKRRSERASKAAKKSWEVRRGAKSDTIADALAEHPQSIPSHPIPSQDEDPPYPPPVGGENSPVGEQESGANSRAAGTNPRAVAVREKTAEQEAEERQRGELIRQIDPGGTIGGTYHGGKGFRLWNDVGLRELTALTKWGEGTK